VICVISLSTFFLAVKNATLVGGQRSQAVFIKQSAQGGQTTVPTLIMNKSGALQVATPSALKAAAAAGEKPLMTKLVAANAQGQLISLDSLTASQQKQIISASAACTLLYFFCSFFSNKFYHSWSKNGCCGRWSQGISAICPIG